MRAKVIDISEYNPVDNPETIRDAGISLVIIRATIGDYKTDPKFEENWKLFEGIIPRGVYHVLRPDISPKDQFVYFRDTLADRLPEASYTLDVEVDADQLPAIINASCQETLELMDNLPHPGLTWIYTRANWWNVHMTFNGALDVSFVEGHPLHIARYPWDNQAIRPEWPDPTDDPGALPIGFDTWELWQFTEKGHVDGMLDNAHDKDISRLDRAEFISRYLLFDDLEARIEALEAMAENHEKRINRHQKRLLKLEKQMKDIGEITSN